MENRKDPIKMIQDAQSKGEPVFVLRAKDICAIKALWEYVNDCKAMGASEGHIAGAKSILREFQGYAAKALRSKGKLEIKTPD